MAAATEEAGAEVDIATPAPATGTGTDTGMIGGEGWLTFNAIVLYRRLVYETPCHGLILCVFQGRRILRG